jgi:hypothetical protein
VSREAAHRKALLNNATLLTRKRLAKNLLAVILNEVEGFQIGAFLLSHCFTTGSQ